MNIQIIKEVDVFLKEKYWLKVNGDYKQPYTTFAEAQAVALQVVENMNNGYPKSEVVAEWVLLPIEKNDIPCMGNVLEDLEKATSL